MAIIARRFNTFKAVLGSTCNRWDR